MLGPPRVGIVGFGRLAQGYYLPALRQLGCPPVAVADPLPSSRRDAERRLPAARRYESAGALLAEEPLDVLLVASPPSTHLAAWRLACDRGVAVFMEKPFLLADQLEAFERRADEPALMIDLNRRFWPTYRRLAADRRAGEITGAHLRLQVDARRWQGVTAHRRSPGEGGALHDLGSHLLDLAAMLLGSHPETIRAATGDGGLIRLDLEMPGGVRACCEVGYADRTREQVTLTGARGTLHLREPHAAIHFTPTGRAPAPLTRVTDAAWLAARALAPGRTLLRYTVAAALRELLDALRAGRPPQPGMDAALRNSAALHAAARSLATGRRELLPALPTRPECSTESR